MMFKETKFDTKDIVLSKKIGKKVYEIAPKTNSNMVYTDEDTTLTETLGDIVKNINSMQPSEDGKGLSSNDFTDSLRDKLENGYGKDEIDSLINDITQHITTVTEF